MKKLLVCILIVCSLLLALVGCSNYSEYDDSYLIWETSEDGTALSNGKNTYDLYGELPLGIRIENEYLAFNNPVLLNDELYSIYAKNADSGIRYLDDYTLGITAFISSDEDKAALDSYLCGTPSNIRFVNYNRYTAIDADMSLVEKLDALCTDKINVAVRSLRSAEVYEIVYFNSEDVLAYTHGAIYLLEDEPYYVNYDRLDNSCFDSRGEFSYGRGTVDMYELPDYLKAEMYEELDDMSEYTKYYTWEEPLYSDEMTRDEAKSTLSRRFA